MYSRVFILIPVFLLSCKPLDPLPERPQDSGVRFDPSSEDAVERRTETTSDDTDSAGEIGTDSAPGRVDSDTLGSGGYRVFLGVRGATSITGSKHYRGLFTVGAVPDRKQTFDTTHTSRIVTTKEHQ